MFRQIVVVLIYRLFYYIISLNWKICWFGVIVKADLTTKNIQESMYVMDSIYLLSMIDPDFI